MNGAASVADPFTLRPLYSMAVPLPVALEAYNYAGRTEVNSRTLTGNVRTFICVGTSTSSNFVNASFTPANPTKALNLSIQNGGLYQCKDPLLGAYDTQGNWLSDFADQLYIAGKADYAVVVPLGQSNAYGADWGTGGALNHRIGVAARRCAAKPLTPSAVFVMVGENDKAAGTSQAGMTTSLQQTIATIRAASLSCPIIVSQTSWLAGGTSAAVRAAQAAVIDNPNGIYLGPDTDTLNNTYRSDTTHFNATGRTAVATLWKNSVVSVLGL